MRRALEPLVAMADQTQIAVWGIIHHNKSGWTDPLQVVMASKAFTAVARSVHTVVIDPDDEADKQRLWSRRRRTTLAAATPSPNSDFTIEFTSPSRSRTWTRMR